MTRFVRYVAVQIVAYGLDWGTFLLAFELAHAGPITSNAIAKVAAGAFAFTLHRVFTFALRDTNGRGNQAIRYTVLLALNVPFSALVLAGVLWLVPVAMAAKVLADVMCVGATYWASRRLVFVERVASGGCRGESDQ